MLSLVCAEKNGSGAVFQRAYKLAIYARLFPLRYAQPLRHAK